jgi:hypothetical protein
MAEEAIAVGVIVEKRPALSPWIEHTWSAYAVLPGLPETAPLTLTERGEGFERYYLGASALILAAGETANYRDNLMSGAPKLWVVMHEAVEDGSLSLLTVTADPSEGEGATQAGSNLVDTVPMPPDIAGFVAAFVAEHHVEREFFKRTRDRPDGEGGGRRRRGDGSGEYESGGS